MSDPKYGEPVEETTTDTGATSVDDAVASAHEGLADAEAARRDAAPAAADEPAVAEPVAQEPAAATPAEPVVVDETAPAEPVTQEPVVTESVDAAPATAAYGSSYADDPVDETYTPGAYSEPETVAATTAAPASDAPTEVVAPAVVAAAPQPIFVQAPEAPRPRGNRAAVAGIGLVAAVVFGLLYLATALGLRALEGDVTSSNIGTEATNAVTSWWFWVPVAVFFLAFWLLGAIINRGRWGHWVIFGLLVGAASYGGHILGQLFQAPFWQLTSAQGADLVNDQLLAPLAIVAFVLGRELTIWFGAWAAARGKRITELNNEAQREYERTLEAGPRLHQA